MHALRLFGTEHDSSHFEIIRSSEMNVSPLLASLGKDELALHYRLILLSRWLTIGVCPTLSPSQSHV